MRPPDTAPGHSSAAFSDAPMYCSGEGADIPAGCVDAVENFLTVVRHPDFACLLGRSVVRRQQFMLTSLAGAMDGPDAAAQAATALRRFVAFQDDLEQPYSVLVASFPEARRDVSAEHYEQLLFGFLQNLHEIDEASWDPKYGSDPNVWGFGFSFAGRGWFPIGMHPGSPRADRRTVMPMVVFNALWQFLRLDDEGLAERMHYAIRERELRRNEQVMPLPGERGSVSGAAQYAGLQPRDGWHCPFQANVYVAPPERPADE